MSDTISTIGAAGPEILVSGRDEPDADVVTGALCDAVRVAVSRRWVVRGADLDDIAPIAADLRAELRRMDIELVPLVPGDARRRDVVLVNVHTQVLFQRNRALATIDTARRTTAGLQADLDRIAAEHAAERTALTQEIARLQDELAKFETK